jgi:hypothetical protein
MTPKIFISYSHHDRDFVNWLVVELRRNSFDVWWDVNELSVGDSIRDKIKEGISASSAFVIILSEYSTKSAWVRVELNSALLYNAAKNNIKIIPIKIDRSPMPADLDNYLFVDASENRLTVVENIVRELQVHVKATYKFDDWSGFSPKTFEDFIYDLLKLEKYRVNRMPQMRDSGFDFEIEDINTFQQNERTLVECKFYKSSVSVATLSQLHGVLLRESKATKALLITNSELTSSSKAYLNKISNRIVVWEGHDLIIKLNKFPELLHKYFPNSTPQRGPVKLIDEELQFTQNLIRELESCPEGLPGWKEYESISLKILKYLFVPPLSEPKIQSRRESGIDIRDAIFPNRATNENWKFIREDYDAKYVVVEFKNYAQDGIEIDKHVVLQINDYLKKTIGRFGIICSRKMPNFSGLQKRKDIFIEHNKLILFVNNEHLKDMLLRKYKKMDPSDVIIDMIDDFSLGF